jgi:SAM-dependent methyltransferase
LRGQFGDIDIYLFDQMLRGRVPATARVLDAGCGEGRNLVYLLRAGHAVYAADSRSEAVAAVQALAARLAPSLPPGNFRCERVEAMSFEDGCADLVISSAVLHFARDEDHFRAMLLGTWRTAGSCSAGWPPPSASSGWCSRSAGAASTCRTGATASWWTKHSSWTSPAR